MNASTRAAVSTGVAALSLGALAVITAVPPESMRTIQVVRPANLTADILPVPPGAPVEPPSDEDLDAAFALIEQLAPVADGRVVTVTLDGHEKSGKATIAPAVPKAGDAGAAEGSSARITGQQAVDDPTAQNAASDLIDGVYSISRYWANYVSLELGPWLINWIPFGYLISDQIYIWYPNFVLPTVDSFVYDFLDPVVNNPLDFAVWIDGIGAVVNTAANGIANGVSDEINYIVTFGWFPIPLPPLPDFPLPGLPSTSASAPATASVVATQSDADAEKDGTGEVAGKSLDSGATEESAADDATEAIDTAPVDTAPVDTAPADTAPADIDTPEGTIGGVTEDGSAERSSAGDVEAPTEDADESAVESADGSTTGEPPAGSTDEPAAEDAIEPGEKLGPGAQSGDAEQSAHDADRSDEAEPDSAPGSDEKSGVDDSDGAATTSTSEGD